MIYLRRVNVESTESRHGHGGGQPAHATVGASALSQDTPWSSVSTVAPRSSPLQVLH
jgi:hypothetical protein